MFALAPVGVETLGTVLLAEGIAAINYTRKVHPECTTYTRSNY